MIHRSGRAVALTVIAIILASSPTANAGGMFLPGRGARPLGRAASFVAGGDDLGAIPYNPAGLALTPPSSALVDLGLVFQRVAYDRIDSGGNALPTVQSQAPFVPIPFVGVAWRPKALGDRFNFALIAYANNASLPKFPMDGPQRYSIVSIEGGAMAIALAASFRVMPNLFIGATLENLVFLAKTQLVLSGCSELNCAPEDPEFDSPTESNLNALFTPSASLGVLYVLPRVRFGASFHLPYWIRAGGAVKSRLPRDPQYDGVVMVGDRLRMEMDLPAILRAGVEVRPVRDLRVEVGIDYEAWQIQDTVRFVPEGVYLDRVPGVGRYDLSPLILARQMQGTIAAHVGGEWTLMNDRLILRAGCLFETSAVPISTLTVMTPDGDKWMATVGAAWRVGRFRLDLGYGHLFQPDRTVTDGRAWQLNPIQPSRMFAVNSGTYRVATDILAVGVEYRF